MVLLDQSILVVQLLLILKIISHLQQHHTKHGELIVYLNMDIISQINILQIINSVVIIQQILTLQIYMQHGKNHSQEKTYHIIGLLIIQAQINLEI